MAAGGLGRYLLRDPSYAHDCRTSAPVRFRRSIRQLLGIEAANLRDIPLDNEFSKCHGWPFAPLLPASGVGDQPSKTTAPAQLSINYHLEFCILLQRPCES